MKASIKFFLYHIIFVFALIGQDTCVSHSFFGDNPLFYYIAMTIIFTTIVCYSGILCNPGYVPLNKEYDTQYFCRSCQRRVPVRAFHCEKCHQCTIRQLYHSEWADTCIGFCNYMFYFLFILSEFVNLLFIIIVSAISLLQKAQTDQSFISWILHHIGLIILIPPCFYYLLQVIILLLQHCYIIITSGNVLETKKFFGLTYLHIQPKSHNPFYSFDLEKNLSESFAPVEIKTYVIQDSTKLLLYNEDIQNYKGIDYVKDPQ